MTNEKSNTYRYPSNAMRICVDQCNDYDVQGRIYSKFLTEPLLFNNCGEMLLKADYMFDETCYPQTFQKRRCFKEKKEIMQYSPSETVVGDMAILEQQGNYSTFDVIVESRKRSSWQGVLKAQNGTTVEEFKSEMDLVRWIWRKFFSIPEADMIPV